ASGGLDRPLRCSWHDVSCPWIDERFGDAHGLGIRECGVELLQAVTPGPNLAPRNRGRMALQNRERPQEVPRFAAPAPVNVEMLAVDLPVRVDRTDAGIGVMPGDHISATVTRQVQPLSDRRGGP